MVGFDPTRELIGWLIRHGELTNMGIWDGWGNFELSLEGHQQAEAAARWLSFERIGRVVSSDVPRARQTAEYLMNTGVVECPYISFDPNLRPWMVADYTGKQKTAERVKEFMKYLENYKLVIPGGESREQLHERIQVVYQYLTVPYKGLPTACFIHNSVIKSLMGLDDIADAVAPGGIVGVFMDQSGNISFQVMLGAVAPEVGVS